MELSERGELRMNKGSKGKLQRLWEGGQNHS